MSINIENMIKTILYKPGSTKVMDRSGVVYNNRIKRVFIPNFIVRLWERMESRLLSDRNVQHVDTIISGVKASNEAFQVCSHNQNICKNYFKYHQQNYLNTLSEWKNIASEETENPSLQEELHMRTRLIAMWLAGEKDESSIKSPQYHELDENWWQFSNQELKASLLHEATNIALRSMLDGGKFHRATDEVSTDKIVKTRIFPKGHDVTEREKISLTRPEDKDNPFYEEGTDYKAKYFSFDIADQTLREQRLNEWSEWLNSSDAIIRNRISSLRKKLVP